MADIKLKPCPFCGGEARLRHENFGVDKYSYCQCVNSACEAKTRNVMISTLFSSDEKAVEIWNRRADNGKSDL